MDDSIRIGLMPPLTGLVGMYGPEIVWAARIACEEVNAAGGVLGRPLELIIEDDGSLPTTAVPAAKRLVHEHHCIALIGNLLSNSRIAVAAQVAEPLHIPYLNFSFYEGSISGRYFFHFAALPNQQIDKMIPYMAHHFGSKMFFAGNNYEWPRGSIDAAKRALSNLAGEVVGEVYLPIDVSQREIDLLLAKVARSGADVFVPYFAGQDQICLLNRFHEMGLKSHMAVVMGHYDEMMASRLAPEVRAGLHSSNTYFMSLDTPENRHILQKLAEQPGVTGIWPHGNGVLTNFGEGTYVCVHALVKALQSAGSSNAKALVAALEHVTLSAPQGMVKMDPRTHHAHVNNYLSCCNTDGTFRILDQFGCIAPAIPARYQQTPGTTELPESTELLAAQLSANEKQLGNWQQILDIADIAILTTNASGIILNSNQCARDLFGYDEAELHHMSVNALLPPNLRGRHDALIAGFVNGQQTSRRMAERTEIMGYRKDGSFVPIEASITKLQTADGILLVVTMVDISERKSVEENLTLRDTHTLLTGLPNRSLLRERLVNTLQRAHAKNSCVALLVIGLDNFKLVNDSHGHEIGDLTLKAVAARLIEHVRPGNTVAHLAADEFAILCEDFVQLTAISTLAESLLNALRQPLSVNQHTLYISASIGIAISDGQQLSAEQMLRYANTALHSVKLKNRGSWQFFSENLSLEAMQRITINNGLRTAIERDEFSLRFQPIVKAECGSIVGAELLLRWHAAQGDVSPALFIPIAEMSGAIIAIGAWVFRQACLVERDWHARWGNDAPYVSVNVSTRQLNETNLAHEFATILQETGADASRLLLEITETAMMDDEQTNLLVLHQLAALGMRIAIDDFGTGYSSLSKLTQMPVQILKIDRTFVEKIHQNAQNRTIVRAVTWLARAMGMKLVAEGVESAEEHREICNNGCDFIQGYFFHRPLLLQDFIATLNQSRKKMVEVPVIPISILIYVSHTKLPMPQDELEKLVSKASASNSAEGITGCLMYDQVYFMQLLEGPRENILQLFEKIRRDPRHEDVYLVLEASSRRRVFSNWGMTLHNINAMPAPINAPEHPPRKFNFMDLAQDAWLCYQLITGHQLNITN